MEKYSKNRHSNFILNYILVINTKNNVEIIDDEIAKNLEEIFQSIIENKKGLLMYFFYEKNYIKIIFSVQPTILLTTLINTLKSASSKFVRTNFKSVKEKITTGFWENSYLLLTLGEDNQKIIEDYLFKNE